MGVISLLWGIASVIWMLIAFVPLLGWGNWFMLPFAGLGLIVSALAYLFGGPIGKGRAKVGLLLNALAMLAGLFRLLMGGGIV